MGISGVGSFPVWSGGSLKIFQLLRYRNLALNRVFLFSLVAVCFTLGGCPYAPYVWMPPVHSDIPVCLDAPHASHMFKHPHMSLSACSGVSAVIGEPGPPFCLDTPMCLDALHVSNTPHAFIYSHACLYVLGVIACTIGETSHMLGAGVLQHICQAFGICLHSIGCPLCFMLYLSCSSLCLKFLLPPLQLLLLQ